MKIDIHILDEKETDEFESLISVFSVVFEMGELVLPNRNYLTNLLKKEHFIVLTAKDKGRVIGGMTCYILDQYYDTKPLAYIYDLAILAEFQRKGIGRQLIEFFNSHCKNVGIAEVFVQADKADDYAIDFYRSTRPNHESPVVHFSYTMNQMQ